MCTNLFNAINYTVYSTALYTIMFIVQDWLKQFTAMRTTLLNVQNYLVHNTVFVLWQLEGYMVNYCPNLREFPRAKPTTTDGKVVFGLIFWYSNFNNNALCSCIKHCALCKYWLKLLTDICKRLFTSYN